MSRIEARRWLVLGLAAFALRSGIAVLTEYKPLFPPYYYYDAVFVENVAWDAARAWRSGRAYSGPLLPRPQSAHAALLAIPYAAVGRRPLLNKLLNALAGSAATVLLGLAFRSLVSAEAAFAAAALVACWPSHAFYTSQNFKESPTLLLAFGACALLLPLLRRDAEPDPRRAAAGALLLGLAGLLRSYVLAVLACSLGLGALLAARSRQGRKAAVLALAAVLAAPLVYRACVGAVLDRAFVAVADPAQGIPTPATLEREKASREWTAAGLGRRRAASQESDRLYAKKMLGREIGTQIEPDVRLETWLDLALFLPRSAFQVLFMPLPGLYPMDGKPGRWLASLENVLLLALAAAAALGLSRSRFTPPRAAALAFFLAMTAGSAFLEFDLGSASRHKLLYLPMLLPFAAEEILRRRMN